MTKCKRNTALYQRNGVDWKGNPRYSPIHPKQLLELNYSKLIKNGKAGECSALSIDNVYIKLPIFKKSKKGRIVKKQEYTKIATVAVTRLPEDIDKESVIKALANPDEKAANFKGAYLLIILRSF